MLMDEFQPRAWDDKKDLIIPGDYNTTLVFCIKHFISIAKAAIADHGSFFVALSGGSTPKAIFERLTTEVYATQINWSKVHLFWSDERAVPPEHPESNYRMAIDTGLGKIGIPENQIHRMHAEGPIQDNALKYEETINSVLKGKPFDLILLGMGEDGHTASLFPYTEGLKATGRLAIANFIPEKKCWRMTLTFECINQALHTAIYVLGASKKFTLRQVLTPPEQPDHFPIQKVGTPKNHALWIADEAAASELGLS